jgi:hypothetical protein
MYDMLVWSKTTAGYFYRSIAAFIFQEDFYNETH